MISTRLSCLPSPLNPELATVITALVDLSKVENSLGQILYSRAKSNSEAYAPMCLAGGLSSERHAEPVARVRVAHVPSIRQPPSFETFKSPILESRPTTTIIWISIKELEGISTYPDATLLGWLVPAKGSLASVSTGRRISTGEHV